LTAEKTPATKSDTSDAQNEEAVERAVPPEVVRSGKMPAHDRDTINMVAAVLLTIFWFGVVMISAALRPASPEVDRVLSWIFGGALVLTGIGGLIWRYVLRLATALKLSQLQIDRLAVTDSMTGVFNHAGFVSVLDRDLARSKRYGHVFSIMVMDIDFFRRINDGYGHAVGDKVIVALAETIYSALRQVDFVGRISGAGFALGLPDTTIEQAGLLAERLRERIASVEVPGSGGEHVRFTVSIGVAMQDGDDAAQIMSRASAVLQRAKDEGRNRVVSDIRGAITAPAQ
jgi:diguanylate cyclase (GGDEF)-like protein